MTMPKLPEGIEKAIDDVVALLPHDLNHTDPCSGACADAAHILRRAIAAELARERGRTFISCGRTHYGQEELARAAAIEKGTDDAEG